MKKTLFTLVAFVALAASADYLYWMVDTPLEGYNWSTAKLVTNDGDELGSVSYETMASLNDVDGFTYSSLGNYTETTSFLIELYNSSNPAEKIGSANIGNAQSLASFIFGDNSMAAGGTLGGFAAHASTFNVPEPTSGLLFLVGGMLLGLRRKRRV
jgi:hypothetical protein